MVRTKHPKYTGAIASAIVDMEKVRKAGKAKIASCDYKTPDKIERWSMKNRGLHQYRFKDNPMEEVYAKAWNLQNTARAGTSEGRGTLDYLLAKDCNYPMGEVTNRDREVAATVIQWLGSPVGQSFVKECQQQKR